MNSITDWYTRDEPLDERKAKQMAWRRQRRERRRARLASNGGHYDKAQWDALCRFFGGRCVRCGASGVELTKDHVLSVAAGGPHTVANLQPLCYACNTAKGAGWVDYREPRHLAAFLMALHQAETHAIFTDRDVWAVIACGGPSPCWLLLEPLTAGNYAPHQIMYRAMVGTIPSGWYAIPVCGVLSCVNPSHLRLCPIIDDGHQGGPDAL